MCIYYLYLVTCFEYDGIDAVKEALRAGQASAGGESKLSIKLIAPPVYVIITVANDKNKGIEELNTYVTCIFVVMVIVRCCTSYALHFRRRHC